MRRRIVAVNVPCHFPLLRRWPHHNMMVVGEKQRGSGGRDVTI